jgi:dienelactone hydrolase
MMRIKTKVFLSLLVILFIWASFAFAQNRVEGLLKEVDTWIFTDTTRMMTYIDSCNSVTNDALMKSPHWESTYNDLSFLLGIDYVGDAQIDNTGRIYFSMRITGQSAAVFWIDEPMSWPHQITPNNWTDLGMTVGYFTVHPSGKYLLVGVMKHGNENFDVYLFNRDGSSRPLLVNDKIMYIAEIFKNEDEFFVISDDRQTRTLCKYTISTGRLDSLYTEEEWFGPDDFQDGDLLCSRWLSFSESQLFILNPETKETKNITDKGLYYGGVFTLDHKVVTLTSALSSKDEFTKFAIIDPAKPKKLGLLYDPGLEVDNYLLIPRAKAIIAALNEDGYSKLVTIDLKGKLLDVPQPEIGVISGLAGNDFGEVIFGFSSPKTSPTCLKFRLGEISLEKLASISTFGFDFSKIDVRTIRYRSTDGTEIPALLYTPKNAKKDGQNPAIVSYHGGPPSQSRPYFQRNIAFALSKGIILMFPNIRGSTGYGPAYEEADNLEGREQSNMDCVSAIDYLIEEGWSSPDKIAIWGGSYGGYVVDWLATNVPEKFACGVSEVGVSDVDFTNTHASVTFQAGWEREMGPVGSELTRKLSPIFKAENVKRPLFLTGGFNDPRVPGADPRRFGWVLNKLGKEVLYFEQTEAGHGAALKTQLIEDFTRSYVFMMDHIMK